MIALVSDIHSNIEALSVVMKDIEEQGADRIFCLGDVIGYGPNPEECSDIIMERAEVCTMGNHDFALVKMPFGFNKLARDAIEWTKKQLKPSLISVHKRKRWKWIEKLPHTFQENRVLYLHASPMDPIMDYVKESDIEDLGLGVGDKIKDIFSRINFLCFVGHTHKPAVVTDDFQYIKPEELEDYSFTFDKNRKYLVNIGSVGQPRDKINTACYVLFDEDSGIRFRRLEYNFEDTIRKIEAVDGLDNRLGERLREGR